MKLFELLQKTISKMPNGWGETVQVDLTNGWTAPSDGILVLEISAQGDVAYVSNGQNRTYISVYAYGGGVCASSNIARKGERYQISHKGSNVTATYAYFTPFSYRGGYLSRLIKRLQSLIFKGVMA